MKTAISIPDMLYEAAERLAERLGISRSELYQRAVKRLVEEHEKQLVTAALNRVYEEKDEKSRLDSVLERLQIASLPREEW